MMISEVSLAVFTLKKYTAMHTLYKLNKTEKIVFTNKIYTYDVNKIIFKI